MFQKKNGEGLLTYAGTMKPAGAISKGHGRGFILKKSRQESLR